MAVAPALRRAFFSGFRGAAPFVLVVGPFGLLFGVVGTEAGLNLIEVMGFSVLVIAGASQFAALQLMTENAPTLVVLGTGLAVNMRMAMYSAALAPHLGRARLWQRALVAYLLVDQAYAVSANEYELRPQRPLSEKFAFFLGAITPTCLPWYLATLIGATVGQAIPEGLALDFAVPITFLAMIGPMLRTPAHIAAALVSITLALLLAGLPFNAGLMVAAVGAMATGAQVELWTERRRK
ncbi:AzlC family ABC transporter permease [Plastorhodobacter daqingensis]|uniref:AzlC family ABC transporter permease n=1 Tax=Plastorhodobacter daqingensis TaxID=1387281 RepID=A0ABW2UH62_9RHOB